jgi:hypothetical protein
MIKGNRVQASGNTATIPPLLSAYGLYTVPTGKTFILTDLICGFRPTLASGLAVGGVALCDKAFGAAVSAFTIGDAKVVYNKQQALIGTAVPPINAGTIVLTDIQNGPEFSTCVTVGAVGSFAIPTYGVWIGGILR